MAEIKSTMDMVLERAARMAASAGEKDFFSEEKEREGMRLAASYMRGEVADLAGSLFSLPASDQGFARRGAVQALLRNILLPRESDRQEGVEKAMHGLMAMGQGDGQLLQVFSEMMNILDGYLAHRDQLKQQLEAGFAQQMEMMEKNLARQTGVAMKLQPSQHPKFQEEWARVQTQLDDQYGRALAQLKELVAQRLTAS